MKDKQTHKQIQDLCDEKHTIADELEKLRKSLVDTENYKIKTIE